MNKESEDIAQAPAAASAADGHGCPTQADARQDTGTLPETTLTVTDSPASEQRADATSSQGAGEPPKDSSQAPKSKGIWVAAAVASHPGLNTTCKLMLALIAGFVRTYGFCHVTNNFIRSRLGLGHNAVERSLAKLEKKGLIERQTVRYVGWSKRTILLGKAYSRLEAHQRRKEGTASVAPAPDREGGAQ